LHLASEEGHLEFVRYLVSKGANVNATDRWGVTPLRGALSHLHSEVAELLRENGAHVRKNILVRAASGLALVRKAEELEKLQSFFLGIDDEAPSTEMLSYDTFAKFLKKKFGLVPNKNKVLRDLIWSMTEGGKGGSISLNKFREVMENGDVNVIHRAMKGELAVKDWQHFTEETISIFEEVRATKSTTEGKNADYIPELSVVDPELFGLSIATVDGQVLNYGDYNVDFPIQSCGKPLLYSLCCQLIPEGADYIHKFVGREPSGRRFNDFSLNDDNKPHNPLINAGAIMTSSLFRPELNLSKRFSQLRQGISAIAGDMKIGFSQAVYLSERDTAYRNFALANYMKSQEAFPKGCDILEATDFYLQLCSMEVNCESLAQCGATYANNGVSVTTNKKVLSSDTVKNTLQIMYSCGMYDFSGEWACTIGLPAKSGVSGCIFMVIPNVLGLCIWSPPLDKIGNSNRGIAFCKEFVKRFKWSIFDVLFEMSANQKQKEHVMDALYRKDKEKEKEKEKEKRKR
jgi:glutaminase A